MATTIRKLDGLMAETAVAEFNKLRLDVLKMKVGTLFHADASTAMTLTEAPLASDLDTAIVRANVVRAAYIAHIASACSATTGLGAHIAADATNTIAAPVATDQTTINTLLNELKGDFNAHRVLTAAHPTADGTNVISAANSTDEGTAVTLVNELFTDINAHFAAAMASQAITLVSP